MLISIANQKGGCAKTTTAVHLALWLQRKGYSVALVDADPQASAAAWIESMDGSVSCFVTNDAGEVLEQAPILAKDTDYVIIDGPPKMAELVRAMLMVSDFALIPLQPSGLDLASSMETVRLINQARQVTGGRPRAGLFLSRAVKNSNLKSEAIESLKNIDNFYLFNCSIHQRQIVADCFGQASNLWDMSGRPAADSAREHTNLFTELLEVIENG